MSQYSKTTDGCAVPHVSDGAHGRELLRSVCFRAPEPMALARACEMHVRGPPEEDVWGADVAASASGYFRQERVRFTRAAVGVDTVGDTATVTRQFSSSSKVYFRVEMRLS